LTSVGRVPRNVSLTMFGNVFARICFLVAGIASARYLGKELYGIYSFAMFFSLLFATLSDGGLTLIMTRETARDSGEAGRYVGSVALMKVGLVLVSLLLLSGALALMDLSPLKVRAVYVAAAANMVYLYGVVAIGVFRAFERMAYESVVLVLQGCVLLVVVLAAVHFEGSVLVLLGAVLVSYAAMTAAGWLLVRHRFVRPEFHIDPGIWRFLFREAVPVGISALLFVSYSRIGTIVLELSQTSGEVGLFNAAFSLTRNLGVIPIAFSGAILPTFAQLAVRSVRQVSLAYTKALNFMLILALPIAVGGMFLADQLIHLIYGPEFAGAGVAFRIVIWALLFLFLSLITRSALQGINRQALWTKVLAAGVGVNVVLNVLLTPLVGIEGASLALLAADVVVFGLSFGLVARQLSLSVMAIAGRALKPLASALLMGAVLYYLRDQNLFLSVLIGAAVYGLLLILLRAFDSQEVALMKETLALDKLVQRLTKPGGQTPGGKDS
jgi:O-antigen/teichoic acid export membrane protein